MQNTKLYLFKWQSSHRRFASASNALATISLARALRPNFRRGSKIALISSHAGYIASTGDDRDMGYRMSKAALNMASKVLANARVHEDVAVAAIHVGSVKTRLNEAGDVSAQASARAIIKIIDGLSPDTTGQFWRMDGELMPW